jgi:hypothetical protein
MTEKTLTVPELALLVGTRVALGVGIGLIVSERMNKDQRKAAGWALLGIGAATTIPLVLTIAGKPASAVRPVPVAA